MQQSSPFNIHIDYIHAVFSGRHSTALLYVGPSTTASARSMYPTTNNNRDVSKGGMDSVLKAST